MPFNFDEEKVDVWLKSIYETEIKFEAILRYGNNFAFLSKNYLFCSCFGFVIIFFPV